MRTPIALFTFNRPEHTGRALASLADCERLDECSLTIFCDGPRSDADHPQVEACRKVVHDWAPRLNAEIIERDKNHGLANSIVAGVSDLTEAFGRVIVLEDDFVLSPDFIRYMLATLDRYEDEPSVYQISGYMFPVEHPASPDAFFLPLTTTWGWATWKRAWTIFDWEATGAEMLLHDPAERKRFDLDGAYPYSQMLENRLLGKNSSWGILWWWAVFRANGYVLHPRKSLVWNGGFDGSGTHCGTSDGTVEDSPHDVLNTRLTDPLRLPDTVKEDVGSMNRVRQTLRKLQTPPSASARLRSRLKRLFG